MAITEIAQLRIADDVSPSDSAFRAKLTHAKIAMEKYTGRTFYWMMQCEDTQNIYVIGEWESLEHHNVWLQSAENKALLEDLNVLELQLFLHIDVPHSTLPLPKSAAERDDAIKKETVYSIGRHIIKSGTKAEFLKTFEENKHCLQNFVTEGSIGGGWRVDKEDDKEEFVLWCPWTNVDQHFAFAKTEGFEKYGTTREFIETFDIKHVKIMDV